MSESPSLDEFLAAPVEQIRAIAPVTMIYAASGTRRAAALAGIPTQGDDFAGWMQKELWQVVQIIFDHGVRHLFMPMLGPSQFNELTPDYREHLWRWFIDGLTGQEALKHYREMGWRVRIACSQWVPQLKGAGELLAAETPSDEAPTLWCFAVPDYDAVLQWSLAAIHQSGSHSIAEAAEALYGENIPPASLYLGTGKPLVASLTLPPWLVRGPLQVYWSQRPGYSLDQTAFRQVLYDYAYMRVTWQKDKSGRAEQALNYRQAWEHAPILGLGGRLGPFWYPAPVSPPSEGGFLLVKYIR
jgi:hypothetical protein